MQYEIIYGQRDHIDPAYCIWELESAIHKFEAIQT